MQSSILAQRYAKALFELSLELGRLEEVRKDMDLLLDTAGESREFRLFLASPVIQADRKAAILHSIFSGKVDELTLRFFELLAKNRRESSLGAIGTEFIELYKIHHNITTVVVQTAQKIGPELRDEIVARLAKRTGGAIDLVEKVDGKLVGGFIVTVGNDQYDASVLTVFNKLKKEFEENLYIRGI